MFRCKPSLKLDQWAWEPHLRVLEEEPHAQGLGALRYDQFHLPADVIWFIEDGDEFLVGFGVGFETGDAPFERLAKSGADLKSVQRGVVGNHRGLLGLEKRRAGKTFHFPPQVFFT
jgi:hypothetical protein